MRRPHLLVTLLLVFTHLQDDVKAYRILGIFPTPFNSHNVIFQSLMKGLARRGHEVVVLSSFPQKEKLPNYTDVSLEFMLPYVRNTVTQFFMSQHSAMEELYMMRHFGTTFCEMELSSPQVQDLIRSQQSFDVVIIEVFYSDCFLGFAHRFGVPFITISSFFAPPWVSDQVGNPETLSFIPNYLFPFTDRMDFAERTVNFFFGVWTSLGRRFRHLPEQTELARNYFGASLPPLWELEKNVSLVFLNSEVNLDYPRPNVPAVVEIGGIHCRPPEALPQYLEYFASNASSGFIYFSLGSILQGSVMPQEKLSIFVDTFKHFPQRVLWKLDRNISDLDSQFMLQKWIPQQDVLGHPNIKLFITHGGLLSLQEAVYHGVPLVVIPVNADQRRNAKRAVNLGIAVEVDYHTLTSSSLMVAVSKVINDTRYKENAKLISRRFRDQIASPLDRAIFWTEYVIRHNGARHLRAASVDLSWYQYFLLDVIGVVLLLLVCAVWLLALTARRVWSSLPDKSRRKTRSFARKFRYVLLIFLRTFSFESRKK